MKDLDDHVDASLGSDIDLVNLLRLAVALWLGYLVALAAIDHLFYPRPIFPPTYYLVNGLDLLIVAALVVRRETEARLGRAYLPLIIGLISLVPVISGSLAVREPRLGPAGSPEGIMLRTLPMLFIALVLTAWRYRWRIVVLFSLGMSFLPLGPYLFGSRRDTALPPVTGVLIQAVSFLVVGYFINELMARLARQRAALARAHVRLVDYAGTVEELSISRERNRLARELHDTLAHTLSALSVQLETAKAYWDVDAEAAERLLDTSLAATRAGLQETRRALKALRAAPLDDLGLVPALRHLAEEAAAGAGASLSPALPGRAPALSRPVEHALYRIAQEALANVVHHADARNLTVALTVEGRDVTLLVADDGVGFDQDAEGTTGHFGLPGMRERARLVNGELNITSQPGAGTRVAFTVKDDSGQEAAMQQGEEI